MLSKSGLTTKDVLSIFADEVSARKGRVTDTFHDGRRLFARSVLPQVEEVRPRDRLQGGVALKMASQKVFLYPYVFRLVCQNGAIRAQTLESRSFLELHLLDPDTALRSIRENIGACCGEELFKDSVQRMRVASNSEADFALSLLPHLSRLRSTNVPKLFSQIVEQFFKDADRSQFGFANAITAVARDTQDPDLRWNLEELGGGVAVGEAPKKPATGGRSKTQPCSLASVG